MFVHHLAKDTYTLHFISTCLSGFHIEKGTSKCIKCIAGKEFAAIQNYDVACKRCKACDDRGKHSSLLFT